MIRLPPPNPKRPINLLHQHQPHQLMRKCHLRKRKLHIRPLQHLIRQPKRPADHKRHLTTPVQRQFIQLRRQLLRRPHLPLDRQGDHILILLDLRQDPLSLLALHLLHLSLAHLFRSFFIINLHELQLAVRGQPLAVFVDSLAQVFLLQFPHGDDRNLHVSYIPFSRNSAICPGSPHTRQRLSNSFPSAPEPAAASTESARYVFGAASNSFT